MGAILDAKDKTGDGTQLETTWDATKNKGDYAKDTEIWMLPFMFGFKTTFQNQFRE